MKILHGDVSDLTWHLLEQLAWLLPPRAILSLSLSSCLMASSLVAPLVPLVLFVPESWQRRFASPSTASCHRGRRMTWSAWFGWSWLLFFWLSFGGPGWWWCLWWFANLYFLFQFAILITITIDETSVLAVISFFLAFTNHLLHGHILFCDSAIWASFTQFLFAQVTTLLIGSRKKTEKLKEWRQFCKERWT